MNIKTYIRRITFLLLPILLLISCTEDRPITEVAQTGKVTFKNLSSYKINIRLGSFSGIILVEHLNTGSEIPVDVRVSDSHATVFSIEYLFKINDFLKLFDPVYGDIFAIIEDLEMQPDLVIEEGRSYIMKVPNPNPETSIVRSSHITIINKHNQPVEFRNLSGALRQTNNNIPIQPYMTGVYKIENIPNAGMLLQGHYIQQVSGTVSFPNIQVKNGFIYRYGFNGTEVQQEYPPFSILF